MKRSAFVFATTCSSSKALSTLPAQGKKSNYSSSSFENDNLRHTTRRNVLGPAYSVLMGVISVSIGEPTRASETVGKDADCNTSGCLGVWDGLLADCPHDNLGPFKIGAGCVSSQDDTPSVFAEPWDYSDSSSLSWEDQMRLLLPTIQLVCSRHGDKVDVDLQSGRYLRVTFQDGKSGEKSTGEFYFTPNDTTVQFRVGALRSSAAFSLSSSLKNMERCELIRKELRYQKLPVLRNRMRTAIFVESDLDTFGPGSASLGPPAEMKTGELEGRQDVDPRLKIDLIQSFPMAN